MNVLPIALLGVAAFFVYRYYQAPSSIGTPDGAAVPPGGGGGSTTGGTPTGGGASAGGSTGSTSGGSSSGSSVPAPPPPAQLSQLQILAGAAVGIPEHVSAADQRGWQLNVDQWNWYREQSGADPIDPGYMPALIGDADRATTITASEYRRRLATKGLGYLVAGSDLWRWQ